MNPIQPSPVQSQSQKSNLSEFVICGGDGNDSFPYNLRIHIVVSGCEEADFNYNGFDINVLANISSSSECSKLCKSNVKCMYWTWLSQTFVSPAQFAKTCFLKTSNKGRVSAPQGYISGGRHCGLGTLRIIWSVVFFFFT